MPATARASADVPILLDGGLARTRRPACPVSYTHLDGDKRQPKPTAHGSTDAAKPLSFVCIGAAPPHEMAKQCDYVTVPSSWTLSDTFNALQAIFIKYREWEDAVSYTHL